jgi:hypothetical protein
MEEEFEESLSFIEQIFDKDHMLLGLIVLFPQTKSIIANPFNEKESQEEFGIFIRNYCLEHNVDHFYIASEAWAVEQKEHNMVIQPSQHPDRQEILVVTLITKEGDTVAIAPIIGAEPPARFLGNWKKHASGAVSRWDDCLKSDQEKT